MAVALIDSPLLSTFMAAVRVRWGHEMSFGVASEGAPQAPLSRLRTIEVDFVAAFNGLEAVWWTAMAACCWWNGRGIWKDVGRTAALLFVFFAVTDVIELQTGAWWTPWWLAVIKGGCIVGLIGCGMWAWRIQRRSG